MKQSRKCTLSISIFFYLILFFTTAYSQTITWEKKFFSASEGDAMQTLPDGGYIVTGGYGPTAIIHTNAQGDSLWGHAIGIAVNSVQAVADGYILSGSLNSHPYIMKMDLTGTKVWERYVGGAAKYDIASSVIATSNALYVTGTFYNNDQTYSLFITKLSLSGDSIWQTTLVKHTTTNGRTVASTNGWGIAQTNDGFIVCGSADTEVYLVKFGLNGNLVWDHSYAGVHSTSDIDVAYSVQVAADGGFIVCGSKSLSNVSFNTVIDLLKTASDGTQQWRQAVGGSGGVGYKVIVESDGYVLTGPFGGNGHLIKTNLQGTIVWDQLLSASYTYGLDKGKDGSYTATGSWGGGALYLGNVKAGTPPPPPRYFVILDAKNNPITNKDVIFYKGTMSPGNDPRIINQTTDANGKIKIDPTWYNNGDNIRAVIVVNTFPTQKPLHDNAIIKGVAYRVMLDNVKFDERTSIPLTAVIFNTYTSNPSVTEQRITLDHTTLLFDLMVSIEWDADKAFTNEMQSGLLLASNYLYDVFDGQVALGNVAIYTDKVNWNGADVCYTASTETWPHAGIQGYLLPDIGENEQVHMPRRWFGDPSLVRKNSVNDNWLSMFVGDTWRTLGHELGHQLFGFRDEYVDAVGNNIDSLKGYYNLGYMDSHYSGDTLKKYNTYTDRIFSSELSSAERYRKLDKISRQFVFNGSDCWVQLKKQFDKTYNGVYCPIYKPSERTTLVNGAITLEGPNNETYGAGVAPYDISSMEKQTLINKNTGLIQPVYTVSFPAKPASIPANLVQTYLKKKSSGRLIDLGLTNNDGKIRFLGSEKGDSYIFSGNVGGKTTGKAVSLNGTLSIHKKAEATIASLDTAIELNVVQGDYRIVPTGSLKGSQGYTFNLKINKSLTQFPSAEIPFDNSAPEQSVFSFDAGTKIYSANLDSLPGSGTILATASDEANNSFIIPFHYSTSSFSSDIYGDNGGAWLLLDTANVTTIQKVTFISSGFSTLTDGLEQDAEQAGNVHSIIIHPSGAAFGGINGLTIRYSKDDLLSHSESSLRIFKWNQNASIWEKIGGSVDTVHNEINAKITSEGTYAAFTTTQGSGVNENGSKPEELVLLGVSENSRAIIHLTLPKRESATVTICNSVGITIATLASGEMDAGTHEFLWNNSTLPTGIYFCNVKTDSGSKTVKITVLH